MSLNADLEPSSPIDPQIFKTCHQGIADGFGEMFFNLRDPTFTQKNVPVRQEASYPISISVVSFILFGAVILGAVGFNNFLDIGGTIAIILVAYFFYIIFAFCCSDIITYMGNIKKISDFGENYQKMRNKRGFFKF